MNKASQLNIENPAAKASFVAWWDTMEAQGYSYGYEALSNVWVGFDDGRKALAKELIVAAEAEERSRFGNGATGVSSALRDKCKQLGVEIE